MPRSNRRRARGRPVGTPDEERGTLEHLTAGWRRTEERRGASWNVQPVGAGRGAKDYVCPGCGQSIASGVAHVVVWRADGVLGDRADLEARRHWHQRCWQLA